MRRRRWVVVGAVSATLLTAGIWLAADRLFPVPVALVGTWENETPLLAAGPGEVRLTIARDGTALVTFDRTRYVWWGADQFCCWVRGGRVFIQASPDQEPEPLAIEVHGDRFRVWDPTSPRPGSDEVVFRRVTPP